MRLADGQTDRQIDRQTDRQTERQMPTCHLRWWWSYRPNSDKFCHNSLYFFVCKMRQTNRQTNRQIDRQTDRCLPVITVDGGTSHKYRPHNKKFDHLYFFSCKMRQIERWADRQTDRQTNRQTHRCLPVIKVDDSNGHTVLIATNLITAIFISFNVKRDWQMDRQTDR